MSALRLFHVCETPCESLRWPPTLEEFASIRHPPPKRQEPTREVSSGRAQRELPLLRVEQTSAATAAVRGQPPAETEPVEVVPWPGLASSRARRLADLPSQRWW